MDKKAIQADTEDAENKQIFVPLKEVLKNSTTNENKLRWCNQLIKKLYIIHTGDAHCAMCLESLKIDQNQNLVLVNVVKNPRDQQQTIDIQFKAPELIYRGNQQTKAGDVWATAICILYILNSSFPWRVADVGDKSFCKWKKKFILACDLSEPFDTVVRQMLCIEPTSRIKVEKILKNMWVKRSEGQVLG